MKSKLVYRRIFSLFLILAILISNTVGLNVFASEDDGYPLGNSAAKTRLGTSSTSRYLLVDNGRGNGSFNHLAVSIDSAEYPAFCIDPDVDFNADYPEYVGGDILSPSQAAKIERMLDNAYPVLTEHQLSILWDIGEIGADEAYDVTQCAIWYIVSEGGYEIPDDLLSGDGYKLYKKLIAGENRAPDSIEIRMEAAAAVTKYSPSGCVYGPFQIAAGSSSSRVNADLEGTAVDVIRGVSDSDYRFVDAGGNEVNELVIGAEYWIEYADSGIFRANLEFIPVYQMQRASGFTQLTSVLGAELVPVKGCTLEAERDTGENTLAFKKDMLLQDSDGILLSESGRWAGEMRISDALVSGIEVELYKWNGAAWVSTGQVNTVDLSGGSWAYVHNESKEGTTGFSGLVEGQRYLLYERWIQRAANINDVAETTNTDGKRVVTTTTYGYNTSTTAEMSIDGAASSIAVKDVAVTDDGVYSADGRYLAKGVEFTYNTDMEYISFSNVVECTKAANSAVYRNALDLTISKTVSGVHSGPYKMYLYESTGPDTWTLVNTLSVSSGSSSSVMVKPNTGHLLVEEYETYYIYESGDSWYYEERYDTSVDGYQNLSAVSKNSLSCYNYYPGQDTLSYTPVDYGLDWSHTFPAICFRTPSGNSPDPSITIRNHYSYNNENWEEYWPSYPSESVYVSTRYIENGSYITTETFQYSDSGADRQGQALGENSFSQRSNNSDSSNRYYALLGYDWSYYWDLSDYFLIPQWENGVSTVRESICPGVNRVTTTARTTKLGSTSIDYSVRNGMQAETVYLNADTKQEISGELPARYLTAFRFTGMNTSADGYGNPCAYLQVLHEKTDVVTYEIEDGMGIGLLLKRDAAALETLRGATFDIIDKATGDTVITNWNLDTLYEIIERNPCFVTPALPNGTYLLREVSPPDGYTLIPFPGGNDTEIAINGIPASASEILTIENHRIDALKPWERQITFRKLNQLGDEIVGAKFNVCNETLEQNYEVNLSTAASVTMILPFGEYSLTETVLPDGVRENIGPISFSIDASSPAIVRIDVENRQESGFYLYKHDRKNANASLSGAVFEIWTAGNDPVLMAELTTEEVKSYVGGLPLGVYTIKETWAPSGFLEHTREYTIVIDSLKKKTIHIFNDNAPVDYGRLEIQKKDDKGSNIGPAVFELSDTSGRLLDTFVTGDDGYYLSDYLPVGEYRLKEISAPEDFVLNPANIVVTVVKDDTVRLEPVNLPDAGWLEIQKIDDKGGNIGPAAFDLYDSDNNLVEAIVTDNEGYYHSGQLPSGQYSLVETSPPDHYILDAAPVDLAIVFEETARVEPVNYPDPVIVPDPPESPDTPDAPTVPDTPDTPEGPDTPEIPDVPEGPDTSDTPADPPVYPSGPSGYTPDPASPAPSGSSEPSKAGGRGTPDAAAQPPEAIITISDTSPGLTDVKLPRTGGNPVKIILAYGAGISALVVLIVMLGQKCKK